MAFIRSTKGSSDLYLLRSSWLEPIAFNSAVLISIKSVT